MKFEIYGQLFQLGEILADGYQTVISILCLKLKETNLSLNLYWSRGRLGIGLPKLSKHLAQTK